MAALGGIATLAAQGLTALFLALFLAGLVAACILPFLAPPKRPRR